MKEHLNDLIFAVLVPILVGLGLTAILYVLVEGI
jgi:hypothetical protein